MVQTLGSARQRDRRDRVGAACGRRDSSASWFHRQQPKRQRAQRNPAGPIIQARAPSAGAERRDPGLAAFRPDRVVAADDDNRNLSASSDHDRPNHQLPDHDGLPDDHVSNLHVSNLHVSDAHVSDDHVPDDHVPTLHVSDDYLSDRSISGESLSIGEPKRGTDAAALRDDDTRHTALTTRPTRSVNVGTTIQTDGVYTYRVCREVRDGVFQVQQRVSNADLCPQGECLTNEQQTIFARFVGDGPGKPARVRLIDRKSVV